jgi:hypothetical protein
MFTNVDANKFIMPGKAPGHHEAACGCSGFVLRRVLPEHAFVALQAPFAIRPLGEPVGDANLRVDRTRAHGDAGLVAGGDDLFETKLAVAENSDKGDEHGDLR